MIPLRKITTPTTPKRGRPATGRKVTPTTLAAPKAMQAKIRDAAGQIQLNLKARAQGRPTNYHPGFDHIARQACIINSTSPELAEMFGSYSSSIGEWMNKYPSFSAAVKEGKAKADEEIEKSLAARARGYSHKIEKVFVQNGMVTRVETEEKYPPSEVAGIFWLKNRKPQQWRDKQPENDGSNPDDTPPPAVAITVDFKDARRYKEA